MKIYTLSNQQISKTFCALQHMVCIKSVTASLYILSLLSNTTVSTCYSQFLFIILSMSDKKANNQSYVIFFNFSLFYELLYVCYKYFIYFILFFLTIINHFYQHLSYSFLENRDCSANNNL